MAIPASTRPLRPFERDCLELLELEGWAPLFSAVEDLGSWIEVLYTREGQDLALIIAGPGDPMGGVQALASKLDQGEFERVIYATEEPIEGPAAEWFRTAGIELLHQELVEQRLRALLHAHRRESVLSPATLRVTKASIRDLGGIHHLQLRLPPKGPVALVGENGVGKSTILEVILALLNRLVVVREDGDGSHPIPLGRQKRNGWHGAAFLSLDVIDETGVTLKQAIIWAQQDRYTNAKRAAPAAPEMTPEAWGALQRAQAANPRARRAAVVAGYGCGPSSMRKPWRNSELEELARWLHNQQNLENETRLRTPKHQDLSLAAVRRAVSSALGERYDGLRILQGTGRGTMGKGQEIVLTKRGFGELRTSQLSDGERRLLAIAGDLARLLVEANPGLDDPLTGGGVVLIDEFELHLHPAWQRTMLSRLLLTFPNIQFILTTHSPQVMSHVPPGGLIFLEVVDGRISVAQPDGVHGWDSNRILDRLMGVPERPADYKRRLDLVATMLDAGELPAARSALDALQTELGADDLEVIRLRAILDFLED